MDEILEAYASRFGVDMSSYLWYFHTGEEGSNFPGGLLFPPPNARVQQIPITIGMLLDCAKSGSWNVDYPSHPPPGRRYDVAVNLVFSLGLLALIVGVALSKGCGE